MVLVTLIFVTGVVLAVSAVLLGFRLAAARRTARTHRAIQLFQLQRESVEERFFHLSSVSGKPRGLRWKNIDFDDGVTFARERDSGMLRALVSVTIRFDAVEGGPMEDVEAVGNKRAATAVFHYDGRRWDTEGRTVFNLNPLESIRHFENQLECVD